MSTQQRKDSIYDMIDHYANAQFDAKHDGHMKLVQDIDIPVPSMYLGVNLFNII